MLVKYFKYIFKYTVVITLFFSLFSQAFSRAIENAYQGHTVAEWAKLLHDRNVDTRVSAAIALRHLGSSSRVAISDLIDALHDNDPRVVDNAVWALGYLGKDAARAVGQLTAIVTQVRNPSRITAVVAIGLIGASQDIAVPVLIAALRDGDAQLQQAAALALGSLGLEATEDAVLPLIQLTRDTNPQVRHKAVIALGRLKAKEAIPSLQILEKDKDSDVRRTAKLARAYIEQNDIPTSIEDFSSTYSSTKEPEKNPNTTNVVSSIRPVQITYQEKPRYTEMASRAKISGTVLLSVLFRADSTVGEVKVLKKIGYGLDERAVEAARKIKFIPAERNGEPVDYEGKIQYSFVQID